MERLRVLVNDELETELGRVSVAKFEHFAEFVARIDVEKGKWNGPRVESLLREPEEYGGVFADGIEEDRALALGSHLAHDVDAFGLKLAQMAGRTHICESTTISTDPIEVQVLGLDSSPFLPL